MSPPIASSALSTTSTPVCHSGNSTTYANQKPSDPPCTHAGPKRPAIVGWMGTPEASREFVADPAKGSKHNRGCAIDLTLFDLNSYAARKNPRAALAAFRASGLPAAARNRWQRALNFTPGTNWSYSNSGYVLAAEIVARVSGKSLAQFSKERLFTPLNMKNTRWRDDPFSRGSWSVLRPGGTAAHLDALAASLTPRLTWADVAGRFTLLKYGLAVVLVFALPGNPVSATKLSRSKSRIVASMIL